VAAPVYTVADIMADPTYRERGDIIEVADDELGPVKMQAVLPRFANHAGSVWRAGPALGADTDLVLRDYLALPPAEIGRRRAAGVI
jgi:crotonobetainyl-CoA:carnitine CoA-transferase CaiB-like acyl-CoA transferase